MASIHDLVTPAKLNRYPEYIKWRKTKEYDLFAYLHSYIIRGHKAKTGGLGLHKFFNKGKLVARWSQENLAKALGTSQSNISALLSSMEKKKFIKKHYIQRNQLRVCVYELGTHDFNYNEFFYVHGQFLVKMSGDKINSMKAASK